MSEIQCTEVDVAIVSEYYWVQDEKCPHCDSTAEADLIESVNERNYETLADLMKCPDCLNLFLVVEQPFMVFNRPIMTRWRIPDTIK